MSHEHDQILLRISCILSVVGALITMLVCAQFGVVQKRKGRDLIFWLSFADLGSSAVYFLSSFENDEEGKNTDLCKTYALLGIFFPVASFLWTDFIAYYLYDMVVNRQYVEQKSWSKTMLGFHAIAWGVSALCILFVAAFGHAGKDTESETKNTGGWCWVHADSSGHLFLWELVGGKFVEWSSCIFILPYFYSATIYRLIVMDNDWDTLLVDDESMRLTTTSGKSENNSWFAYTRAPCVHCYQSLVSYITCPKKDESTLKEYLSDNAMHIEDTTYDTSNEFVLRSSDLSNASKGHTNNSYFAARHDRYNNDESVSDFDNSYISGDTLQSVTPIDHNDKPNLSRGTTSSDKSKINGKPSFRQFYMKMVKNSMCYYVPV